MQRNNHASHRGFAAMDEEKHRQISSKGGRAAHASGNAHEFQPGHGGRPGKRRNQR